MKITKKLLKKLIKENLIENLKIELKQNKSIYLLKTFNGNRLIITRKINMQKEKIVYNNDISRFMYEYGKGNQDNDYKRALSNFVREFEKNVIKNKRCEFCGIPTSDHPQKENNKMHYVCNKCFKELSDDHMRLDV